MDEVQRVREEYICGYVCLKVMYNHTDPLRNDALAGNVYSIHARADTPNTAVFD